jgi:hypothetical protein
MNQAEEIIQKIENLGGSIKLEGGDYLRIETPRGTLTNKQKDDLDAHKQDILKILRTKLLVHCQGCPCHEIGPDPFGKNIIHWCGPFKEPDTTRWLNIAELTACPLGKWGVSSKTVH